MEHGAFPAKSVVGEPFDVTATVFRDGHDAVNATVVLTDPDGGERQVPMTLVIPGLDHWSATISADWTGTWSYRIEGWADPYGTWAHDAAIKVAAEVDTELMLLEGALLLGRALKEVTRTRAQAKATRRRDRCAAGHDPPRKSTAAGRARATGQCRDGRAPTT